MGENDTFFRHFIVGCLLLLGIILAGLIGLIVVSLWSAGLVVFVIVVTVLWTFSWAVHKLASNVTVKKWMDDF